MVQRQPESVPAAAGLIGFYLFLLGNTWLTNPRRSPLIFPQLAISYPGHRYTVYFSRPSVFSPNIIVYILQHF